MANSQLKIDAPVLVQVYFALVLLLIAGFNIGCCHGHHEFSDEIHAVESDIDSDRNTIGRSSFKGRKDHQRHIVQLLEVESNNDLQQQLSTRNFEERASSFEDHEQKTWRSSTPPAIYTNYLHRKLRASMPLCSMADLSITQGLSGYSNGIPAYTVQIVNLCMNPRCQLSNIHVACGAFSSARPLDNLVFERLSYNDCYVMNGAPLRAGASVAFEYANSSEYPMHVISAEVGPCAT